MGRHWPRSAVHSATRYREYLDRFKSYRQQSSRALYIFAGTNTYTGLTTIGSQATLKVTGSLGDKSNLSLLDQGTYVVAASDTVNSVWSEATSIISIEAGQNLTIGGADGDSTIEGKISGSGVP